MPSLTRTVTGVETAAPAVSVIAEVPAARPVKLHDVTPDVLVFPQAIPVFAIVATVPEAAVTA